MELGTEAGGAPFMGRYSERLRAATPLQDKSSAFHYLGPERHIKMGLPRNSLDEFWISG
jgi:hypothetical protein